MQDVDRAMERGPLEGKAGWCREAARGIEVGGA